MHKLKRTIGSQLKDGTFMLCFYNNSVCVRAHTSAHFEVDMSRTRHGQIARDCQICGDFMSV